MYAALSFAGRLYKASAYNGEIPEIQVCSVY